MTRAYVRKVVLEHVTQRRTIEQMMGRIDDRQIRLEDRLVAAKA